MNSRLCEICSASTELWCAGCFKPLCELHLKSCQHNSLEKMGSLGNQMGHDINDVLAAVEHGTPVPDKLYDPDPFCAFCGGTGTARGDPNKPCRCRVTWDWGMS